MNTKPGIQAWRAKLLLLFVSSILLAMIVSLLTSCTDATGPSAPADLHPQFQKTAQDGLSTGGGGGDCQYPQHWSAECSSKRARAQTAGVGTIGACRSGFNWACAAGAIGTGIAWIDYQDTPGADGIPYDSPANSGGLGYPECQFQCMTRNDPPFNQIPGGGYLGENGGGQ